MKKLALLLTMLPLVALADVADPFTLGINGPFPAVFIVAVGLAACGLILVYRFRRSVVGRLLIFSILIFCGLVGLLLLMLVSYVNCTACSGRGYVRGRYIEKCRCCEGSGEHIRWISEKCQTFSEMEDRIRTEAVRKRFDEAVRDGENKSFGQHGHDDGLE